MKQIIWIFGTSAAGKETFMKTLLHENDLQEILGIDGKRIAISKQSLENLGKLDKSRASIVNEVRGLLKFNEVVVIKWQYADSLLRTPNTLYSQFMMYKHSAVKLSVTKKEQIRRLKTKTWWHDEGAEGKFLANELLLVEKSIEELNAQFIITDMEW
ncbi:hypothetical protein EOL96_02020 [Candidatus Saccharibacteria bacterium]|nr:hypothetical protein [Candidatus Saccharibacteria bacterium]